jgi:hypothetical protein
MECVCVIVHVHVGVCECVCVHSFLKWGLKWAQHQRNHIWKQNSQCVVVYKMATVTKNAGSNALVIAKQNWILLCWVRPRGYIPNFVFSIILCAFFMTPGKCL